MVVEVHVVCWRKFFYPKKQYKINQKYYILSSGLIPMSEDFILKKRKLEDIDTFNL